MTRMSRNVTLVLVGAAALTACCCVVRPPWRDDPPDEPRVDENGNPLPSGGGAGRPTAYRRSAGFPWRIGRSLVTSGYSAPYRSPSRPAPGPPPAARPGPQPPGPPARGPGVTGGGFGRTGQGMTGAS